MTTTDVLIALNTTKGPVLLFGNGHTDNTTEEEFTEATTTKSLGLAVGGARVLSIAVIASVGSILDYIVFKNGAGAEVFKVRLHEGNIPTHMGLPPDISVNIDVDGGMTVVGTTSD